MNGKQRGWLGDSNRGFSAVGGRSDSWGLNEAGILTSDALRGGSSSEGAELGPLFLWGIFWVFIIQPGWATRLEAFRRQREKRMSRTRCCNMCPSSSTPWAITNLKVLLGRRLRLGKALLLSSRCWQSGFKESFLLSPYLDPFGM